MAADLRTLAALGVHAVPAVSVLTVQDSRNVEYVEPVAPDLLVRQLEVALHDIPTSAAKIGLLASSRLVEVVASLIRSGTLHNVVVDPVLASSSGTAIANDAATAAYVELLVPRCTIVTPNIPEAERLTGIKITTTEEMTEAAEALCGMGAPFAVVKGGHLGGGDAPDVVAGHDFVEVLAGERITSHNTRGTGCTLSSAIAAYLATGWSPVEAITKAKHFVAVAIAGATSWQIGFGNGPIDQLGWSGLLRPEREPGQASN